PYLTVLEGMREIAKENGADTTYHRGCGALDKNDADLDGAEKTARESDVIVLVTGDTAEQAGEQKDRANLDLSGAQQELFDRLRKLGKPLVTVLVSSKPLSIPLIAEETDALIAAFNGGMFGGLAVAEVVFGKINPSGKLPISFPRHSGQLPVYYNAMPGWHGGKYMDLPATPLFTFGEGLSYTEYKYSNLTIDEKSLVLRVDVTNTGTVDGAETAQVYFRDKVSSVMTPVMQLIAFQKIALKAGETKTVTFRLDRSDFSLITPDEKRVTEPGAFLIMVGPSAREDCLLKIETVL
ncbi:MAG: glycoside hydrolase family 3 C-terminal domain-containing protein, partial [Defluviitaleaceae bacterium]|nr:glycoside hydrolase family 3 C-terminal domain-containing protein [Defluviitaleaceae bacterium]